MSGAGLGLSIHAAIKIAATMATAFQFNLLNSLPVQPPDVLPSPDKLPVSLPPGADEDGEIPHAPRQTGE